MNAEMYARVGGKALPEDNLSTVKVINFVDKSGKPVSLTGPQGPAGPAGPAASITKAAHVDPSSGSVAAVVTALINAGLMASA